MKKDELILHPWRWRGKKMLVMKLVMLMVLLPVFAFAMPTYSQKQIKMEVQDVSLEQVLKELHAQSNGTSTLAAAVGGTLVTLTAASGTLTV